MIRPRPIRMAASCRGRRMLMITTIRRAMTNGTQARRGGPRHRQWHCRRLHWRRQRRQQPPLRLAAESLQRPGAIPPPQIRTAEMNRRRYFLLFQNFSHCPPNCKMWTPLFFRSSRNAQFACTPFAIKKSAHRIFVSTVSVRPASMSGRVMCKRVQSIANRSTVFGCALGSRAAFSFAMCPSPRSQRN